MTRPARTVRLAGISAVFGGLLWVILVTGHTFTHGSTQSPRNATILGIGSLNFFRLLAVPPLFFAAGLVGARATRASPETSRRAGWVGLVMALVGLGSVTLGVMLETWITDPNVNFSHPAVQTGWVLYLLGLFPVLSAGMILFGLGSTHLPLTIRRWAIVIGVFAPLQWLEGVLSSASTGSLGWDLTYSGLRGCLGVGWIAMGVVLWRERQ